MKYLILLSALILSFQDKPKPDKPQDVDSVKKELIAAATAQPRDLNAIDEALKKLVKFNDSKAVKAITDFGDAKNKYVTDEDTYWLVMKALAAFTSKSALEEVGKYIIQYKTSISAIDTMFLLQGNVSFELLPLLKKVLKEGSEPLKLMAIDRFTASGEKESVKDLISALEKESSDSAVKQALLKALRDLTGDDGGKTAKEWNAWIKKKSDFIVKKNKQGGETLVDITREVPVDNLRKWPKEAILVLTSGVCKCGKDHNYDTIEEVLKKMKIPHKIVTKADIDDDKFTFKDCLALLSNCTRWKKH